MKKLFFKKIFLQENGHSCGTNKARFVQETSDDSEIFEPAAQVAIIIIFFSRRRILGFINETKDVFETHVARDIVNLINAPVAHCYTHDSLVTPCVGARTARRRIDDFILFYFFL